MLLLSNHIHTLYITSLKHFEPYMYHVFFNQSLGSFCCHVVYIHYTERKNAEKNSFPLLK